MIAAGFWWGFLAGLFVGAIVGVFVAALMAAAASSDRTAEEIYRRLPDPHQENDGTK
jgi:gas vesicle protein